MKEINLIKILKIKNLYKLYIIIKNKTNKYKSYIYSKKYLLNLVYSNIIGPFNYNYKRKKYFIIFLNNYNKYFKIKVLENKNNIYIIYLYYII